MYTYADAVDWAQNEADRAITLWDAAEAQGAAALVAHREDVRSLQAGQGLRHVEVDVPFTDPSGPAHQAAQDVLFNARMTLDVFAKECVTALDAAAANAAMPLTAEEARSAMQTTLTEFWVDQMVVKPFQSFMDFLTVASKTLWEHPDILLELLGGAASVVGGAALVLGGGGVSLTGGGALVGAPAIAGGATLVGAGGAMLGDAAGRWFSEAEHNHGIDRGDGRDDAGHFAKGQEEKPWVDKERLGLDKYADEVGANVVRDKVRASFGGAPQEARYYDGLVQNSDGTYTALEIKSGNAIDRYNSASSTQRQFDDAINAGTPAHARLNGDEITISKVLVREEP